MSDISVRPMRPEDRIEVAELIYVSTNYWFEMHFRRPCFTGGPAVADIFYQVYHTLPGSSGLVAEDTSTGRLIGSCFCHVRPTHVSLGIMNAHPGHFGRGAARAILSEIITVAERESKPVRLVSSAMNLDSFSLYTRAGFVPRTLYQDIRIEVPEAGLSRIGESPGRVRPAAPEDVPAMVDLELEVSGIRRDDDHRVFVDGADGFWRALVHESESGLMDGFLVSTPRMLGPGVMRTQEQALALLAAELDRRRGEAPVLLAPVQATDVVQQAYAWGGRNVELHMTQSRGHWQQPTGIVLPTFMPESG